MRYVLMDIEEAVKHCKGKKVLLQNKTLKIMVGGRFERKTFQESEILSSDLKQ